ncbi:MULTISPECIES: 6-phosphofructokinase [Geobacter]|uniref:ATP-dependent 6-phosphofructokinase n=2 Tax=Geobacter TaxID=28231 RepID=A0A0C1TRM8_9BACT|nr:MULTISPECIES: 6-phosphofructokinase [Geobacter]ANA40029.1 ATP-dependent 6-phosphofructokinase [Geobacter anodireducens]KIE41908.1 6-phosphofructokinase [Geobacter soli]MBE2886851.1 6-phosphofructokinase [Geobacter anodireducens]HMN03084.1 6-phosphofructokinase [Geobacter anodireducens]
MKKIGILTSGGDCPGMNAAIRAAVRTAIRMNIEVVGFRKGYLGLMKGDAIPLDTKAVSGILHRGGTFLQSARSPEFKTPAGQRTALNNLKALGVEGMVVMGGDGSLTGALALHGLGVPVVGIPASIDNDIPFTDMSLGVDTALNNIIYAVDCIKDTASSHARAFVIEVMGRNSGYLASISAIATGAEYALVPEREYDLAEICQQLRARYEEGRDNAIIILAEGAGHGREIADSIKDAIGFETRATVLGHYQRGGAPTVFDRLLASRFGKKSVELLVAGTWGVMVGLSCNAVLATPLEDVIKGEKRPQDEVLRLAEVLGV